MAKRKLSMAEIVNFMIESDDDIDLGDDSADKSNLDSDWEYEIEPIKPTPGVADSAGENDYDDVSSLLEKGVVQFRTKPTS